MKQFLVLLLIAMVTVVNANPDEPPVKMAIIGLTHTHVHWILGRENIGDVEIVGVVEPNRELAQRYANQHGYSMDIVYNTMQELVENAKPEAVLAFGSIYQHLEVVEFFAPLGVHVMVEKPLAVSMEHANKMKELAQKHQIHLLTNYETSWYATNTEIHKMTRNGQLGDIRKIVVHDGHQGPKEIGVNDEFLDWLTDPVLNGGGALTDFGCYGANLITWLLKGQKPLEVTAMTQTNKPEIYPKVDDEATILLKYDGSQGIIQASWNWPFSRKDMEVYGTKGYAVAEDSENIRIRLNEKTPEETEKLEPLLYPYNDPFALFAALIKGEYELPEYDVSSLENNLLVVEILDAAKNSANSGKTIQMR